jgi:hypothetical protein
MNARGVQGARIIHTLPPTASDIVAMASGSVLQEVRFLVRHFSMAFSETWRRIRPAGYPQEREDIEQLRAARGKSSIVYRNRHSVCRRRTDIAHDDIMCIVDILNIQLVGYILSVKSQ